MSTNLIESGQLARSEGASLLAKDKAALDARCEDARCKACGRPPETATSCEHFGVCDWPAVGLIDEAEDTAGGAAD